MEFVFVGGGPTPNYQLCTTLSPVLSCLDYSCGGRLPAAAVSVNTTTHKRTAYTQRLSLAEEPSEDVGACNLSLSLSSLYYRHCSITAQIDMVLQQYNSTSSVLDASY